MSAVQALSAAGAEERGAIFTRREVVDFLLDLVGYRSDRALTRLRLLEPSFGAGDFLIPAVERLLTVWRKEGATAPYPALSHAIRAVELHRETFTSTYDRLVSCLVAGGVGCADAEALADEWLIFGDFLLTPLDHGFDVVVGNPPYVRQELIADALLNEYRARYRTLYDRADLYVPFIQRALELLSDGGQLGFICADRWMKNRYGGPLRQMVAEGFHLKVYVDMVGTDAFHAEVAAYPAIFVIARARGLITRVAYRPAIEADALAALSRQLCAPAPPVTSAIVKELHEVTEGAQPWLLESSAQLSLIRRLEMTLPTLEEAGCRVGIGVATGADRVFIGAFDALDVEPDRKLPLAMTRDIAQGFVKWQGCGVINPFGRDGQLVDLSEYPMLKRYLEAHRPEIMSRHVARKSPGSWYRTIDRIHPDLACRPKLLIPDIKGQAHIVYENQGLYPHHNLYYITSDSWDLRALQAVLRSGIARLFVGTYSTRMRGGYLRFQAQYLRRIRIPAWSDVSPSLQERLRSAAERGDISACNQAVSQLYGLDLNERAALGGAEH